MRALAHVLLALLVLLPTAEAAEVRVLAASSLTDALTACAERFEADSGIPLVLGFAGSSKLARQIEAGAAADVVVTADVEWMQELAESDGVVATSRLPLLRTELAVVVPHGAWQPENPGELTDPRLKQLAVAGEAVPAGRRAREALVSHGIWTELAARTVVGTHVRSTLALAARNEVDAAIVYASDARISRDVDVAFVFSPTYHAPILYPVALTPAGQANPDAVAFYQFLFSEPAAEIFAAAGFETLGAAAVANPGRTWEPPTPPQRGWGPLTLSLWVGGLSLLLSLPPGILLGWLLARREFYGKTLVTVVAMSPLVLPPVVTGFLLLRVFGRNGWLGPLLDGVGLQVAFTRWGAVIAAAVVGFPLLVQLVRQAIEAVDPRYEQAAQTLGRHPLHAFATVTFPLALPGIAAGAVLAFTRALGEFGATAVLAGDIPGETRTLALALFSFYETPGKEDQAMQLVWVSLALSAVALTAYEVLTRLQRRRLEL